MRLIDAVRLDVKRALETFTVGLIPITGASRSFCFFLRFLRSAFGSLPAVYVSNVVRPGDRMDTTLDFTGSPGITPRRHILGWRAACANVQ